MTLEDLIKFYPNSSSFDSADFYINKHEIIDIEINNILYNFIDKLQGNKDIKSEEFDQFIEQLDALNGSEHGEKIRRVITHLIFDVSNEIYNKNKVEISKTVAFIDENVNKNKNIPQTSPQTESFIGLVNVYHLFTQNLSINEGGDGLLFPNIGDYKRKFLACNIPFAINALVLTGKHPKADINGVNTTNALYPINLKIAQEHKEPIRKGVKNSDEYYPYKQISKLAKGDTGDNTFLATNGSKILFMRGVERYAPEGILASKIATLVSPSHFSSERLMDNKIAGSRAINNYKCSAADPATNEARVRYIEINKKVFPGTGIIDEINNYVFETDPNTENLGFSSENIMSDATHLSKIDFDRCYPSEPATKENYEMDIVTKLKMGIYKGMSHVQNDTHYIQEKLYTRLKLSMMTEELLNGLADKAFLNIDQGIKQESIQQCVKRSDIALELFWEHPKTSQFLKNNPLILEQCRTEITNYIQTHFDKIQSGIILNSLEKRCELIICQKEKKLTDPSTPPPPPCQDELINTQNFKDIYSKSKGDYLINQALSGFKEKIELSQTEEELDKIVAEFKTDPQYKTSSINKEASIQSEKALDEIIEGQRARLKNSPSSSHS